MRINPEMQRELIKLAQGQNELNLRIRDLSLKVDALIKTKQSTAPLAGLSTWQLMASTLIGVGIANLTLPYIRKLWQRKDES